MKDKVLYSIIALLTIVLASQSETAIGFFKADYVEAKDRSQTQAAADTRKPVAVMQVNEGPLVRQVRLVRVTSAPRGRLKLRPKSPLGSIGCSYRKATG